MNQNFSFTEQKVHIVVNRTVLMNLLTFFKGPNKLQQFHLELDMEGETLIIDRKVWNGTTYPNANTRSYRHGFEAALTTKDSNLEDPTGQHRAIMYLLGHLNIILRYEVDAYMDESEVPNDLSVEPCQHPDNFQDVEQADFADPNISPTTVVIPKGRFIKQNQLIEMKSGNTSRPLEQMWFGRTPSCINGHHTYRPKDNVGVWTENKLKTQHFPQSNFRDIEAPRNDVEDAGAKGLLRIRSTAPPNAKKKKDEQFSYKSFEYWVVTNQQNLKKLVWLLQKLYDTVQQSKNKAGIFVYLKERDDHRCMVYDVKERRGALPKDLVEHFWSSKNE